MKTTLKGPGGKPMLIFDNQKIQYSDSGIDVNYDDYAFEMVSPTKAPAFQLIMSKDYNSVYLNARVITGNQVMILKDTSMDMVSPEEATQPQYKPDRIFKYPSYLYEGERD